MQARQRCKTGYQMNVIDRARYLAQLKRHEGERLTAYLDTVGILTVGVGHNCKASPVPGVEKPGDRITQEVSNRLFFEDVQKHEHQILKSLPWISGLVAPRQAVLFNMAFNLGVAGLLSFKNTLSLIEQGKYLAASDAMLKSKWATQVKGRAVELAEQMRTGKWQNL